MDALQAVPPQTQEPKADWDPYCILGIDSRATEKQIRAAYRRLAKTQHSDASGDDQKFITIKEAHDFLLDPASRNLWDKKLVRISAAQKQTAQQGLRQLCEEVLNRIVSGGAGVPPEHADIPKLLRKELVGRIDKLVAMKAEAERQLTRHHLMLGTTTRKNPGENLVELVISNRIDAIKRNIATMDGDLTLGEIMLSEIGSYRSTVETTSPVTRGTNQMHWPTRPIFGFSQSSGGLV